MLPISAPAHDKLQIKARLSHTIPAPLRLMYSSLSCKAKMLPHFAWGVGHSIWLQHVAPSRIERRIKVLVFSKRSGPPFTGVKL